MLHLSSKNSTGFLFLLEYNTKSQISASTLSLTLTFLPIFLIYFLYTPQHDNSAPSQIPEHSASLALTKNLSANEPLLTLVQPYGTIFHPPYVILHLPHSLEPLSKPTSSETPMDLFDCFLPQIALSFFCFCQNCCYLN